MLSGLLMLWVRPLTEQNKPGAGFPLICEIGRVLLIAELNEGLPLMVLPGEPGGIVVVASILGSLEKDRNLPVEEGAQIRVARIRRQRNDVADIRRYRVRFA